MCVLLDCSRFFFPSAPHRVTGGGMTRCLLYICVSENIQISGEVYTTYSYLCRQEILYYMCTVCVLYHICLLFLLLVVLMMVKISCKISVPDLYLLIFSCLVAVIDQDYTKNCLTKNHWLTSDRKS